MISPSGGRAAAKKIGPAIVFERLWQELETGKIIRSLLKGRKFEFDVERAIFLTVLHRLFVSGSDRYCDKWRRDYRIDSVESLSLHHLYRGAWANQDPAARHHGTIAGQNDLALTKVGRGWGEIHRTKQKGLRLISATPLNIGSSARTRTMDPLVNSQLLYRLSY